MWPFKKKQIEERAESPVIPEGVTAEELLLAAFLPRTNISRDEAMQIPSFAGCVNKICDTVAIIPINLYKVNSKGSTEEVKDDERVYLINRDTGDTLDGPDFKRAMVYDYLTDKGGYAYVNRQGKKINSLNYVEANRVGFMEGTDPVFKDFKMTVNGKEYDSWRFIRMLRRSKNGAYGKSLILENNLALSVAYSSLKFEGKLMKRGGNKKGFLESEHKIDQNAVDYLKESFNKLYTEDSENAIVLNDGVKFHESSESSVEMQLNENKKANSSEICKLFGMPPGILSGGATDKEWQQYIQYCIIPILESFVKALDRALLLENEQEQYFFGYDVTELTRADIKTRYDAYEKAYKNGFLQIDEIRELEKYPALDIPFFKMGLQDVLYDPSTGDIFMPNMNKWANIKDPSKFPSEDGGTLPGSPTGAQKTDQQPDEDTEKETGKEVKDSESNSKS